MTLRSVQALPKGRRRSCMSRPICLSCMVSSLTTTRKTKVLLKPLRHRARLLKGAGTTYRNLNPSRRCVTPSSHICARLTTRRPPTAAPLIGSSNGIGAIELWRGTRRCDGRVHQIEATTSGRPRRHPEPQGEREAQSRRLGSIQRYCSCAFSTSQSGASDLYASGRSRRTSTATISRHRHRIVVPKEKEEKARPSTDRITRSKSCTFHL